MKPAPLIVVALGSNLGPSARILGEAAQCLSGAVTVIDYDIKVCRF